MSECVRPQLSLGPVWAPSVCHVCEPLSEGGVVSDWFLVSAPHRISLEDLSPSVVLHMTEKLGYKNSDVINTVLSNRACHILAIYFLLNKKLERYLSGVSGTREERLLPRVMQILTLDPCCYFSLKREAESLEGGKHHFLDGAPGQRCVPEVLL